jgi:two-component system phosphate regulon sensor histidine kinase PhoR
VAKTAASVQGSGLGLAIVQQILARHDGRFVVESTVGEGTACRIWLPLLS